jgi:hypothetical protein
MAHRLALCAGVPLAVALCASAASAQRLNIDIDFPGAGPALGGGVPSAAFGAASGQAGVWNSFAGTANGVPSGGLFDLSGAITGATITMTSAQGGSLIGFNNATNSGDYALLMNDGNQVGTVVQGGMRVYTLNGLSNGMYTLYTYAAPPQGIAGLTTVSVSGATSPNPQQAIGPASNNLFAQGATHTIHDVLVTNGTMTITVTAPVNQGVSAYINGFQLVPTPGAMAVLAMGGLFAGRRRR